MANEILVVNGPDINPMWDNMICISHDFSGTTLLGTTAGLNANGQLLNGQAYYYKVVARMNQLIIDTAVTGGQMASWAIKDPHSGRIFWRLWDDGGVRKVQLYRSPDIMLAYGYRTGDGAVILNSVNDAGTSGSVTVTYTAADNGYLDISRDALVGYEEVTATPTANNRTIDLAWTAQQGLLTEYRIYRGTTSGVYDRFFTVATNAFSDTGLITPLSDVKIPKKHLTVSSGFIPSTYIDGVDKPAMSYLTFNMKDHKHYDIDLVKVTNQPTWNLGTQAATQQAENDVQIWL